MPVFLSIGRIDKAPLGSEVLSTIFANSNVERGVELAGFNIIGHPEAIAGAILCMARFIGKLKGAIPATNPTGKYFTQASLPLPANVQSIEIYSPSIRFDSSAATIMV